MSLESTQAIQKTPGLTPTKPSVSFWATTLLTYLYTSASSGCADVLLGRWQSHLLWFTQKADKVQEPHTSSLAVLLCQVYFTCIQLTPLSRRQTALTTARHPEIQAEGAQLLISHTTSSATRSSPFMNITSEFQYPREPEIIQLISSTQGD